MEGYKPQDFSFFHCGEKLVQRVDVGNARADIYELQWLRIGILKEMGNRASLVEALKDYCTVIGYNQEKAKTMLDSLESE